MVDMVKHSISTIGSHSALEVSEGAKQEGFNTIVVCQKGREKTYEYYKKRKRGKEEIGIIDEIVLVDKFVDIVNKKNHGFAKPNNQGAKKAMGQYLFLLNNHTKI